MNQALPAFQIRQGTQADRAFLAWCNYESSSPAPGFCYWDPLLAGLETKTIDFLDAVFATDALAWGRCEDFTLLEVHGKPIAAASGFEMDANDYRPFRMHRLPALAERLGWDRTTLTAFQDRYQAIWSDPRDTTLAASAQWTLECVAVVPEMRSRGVAKALINAILERGKARGHTSAGIAVTIGNEPARRVYEAVGFEMYITYGAAYFDHTFSGTIKYRMNLTNGA